MTKFSVTILKPDTKTAVETTYPVNVVKAISEDFKNNKKELKFKILDISKDNFNVDYLEKAPFSNNVSSAKMKYTDDGLFIQFVLSKKTPEYKLLVDKNCIGFASGIGELDEETGIVSDYELKYVVIVPKDVLDENNINVFANRVIEK